MFDGIATHIAHSDLSVFAELLDELDQLSAPLLVQRRDGNTEDRPVIDGIQSEVAIEDRLVDCRQQVLLPWLDGDRVDIGRADIRHLPQRHLAAIVLDLDIVQ